MPGKYRLEWELLPLFPVTPGKFQWGREEMETCSVHPPAPAKTVFAFFKQAEEMHRISAQPYEFYSLCSSRPQQTPQASVPQFPQERCLWQTPCSGVLWNKVPDLTGYLPQKVTSIDRCLCHSFCYTTEPCKSKNWKRNQHCWMPFVPG